MPFAAPRGCPRPHCRNVQPCPHHPIAPQWSKGERGRKMPPGWAATRARILARDPFCRWCCEAPAVEVHHLIPGDEHDELLVGLCHECHQPETVRQALDARGLL